MTTWTAFKDYRSYEHVLAASADFCHPTSGNVYFSACEKKSGVKQNLVIYRRTPSGEQQTVATFEGGTDAQAQITPGGWVATSLTPKGVPYVTQTGFQGVWCVIPGIDEAWSLSALEARLLARMEGLEQRVVAIETALGNVAAGGAGLSPEDRDALEWTKKVIALG
jgi:hypothetical protein